MISTPSVRLVLLVVLVVLPLLSFSASAAPLNATATIIQNIACPKHFVELAELPGRCYAAIREPLTWFDARQVCMMYGADLAHIEGFGEHAMLVAYIKEYASLDDYPRLDGYWLGGHRYLGSWQWSDTGEDITWSSWKPGEPNNNDDNQRCVVMYKGSDYDWDDISCHVWFEEGAASFSHVVTHAALCKTLK